MVVGGGGREHALVDKYTKSPHVERLIAIPGNDLMTAFSEIPVVTFPTLKTTDVSQIVEIARQEGVDLVDVAQDNAIEAGVVDALEKAGIPAVGPTRSAGEIEWNKAWSREFGARHDLPQPSFRICLSQEEGLAFLDSQIDQPWFVKAAYLAAGKGALPARNNEEAKQRVRQMQEFNGAGDVYLIEKWLAGDDGEAEEFSSYVFSDGKNYKYIGSAQDHKRVGNFDEGENTGGMGCFIPPLIMTPEFLAKVEKEILEKTFTGLSAEGRPYKGVLYLGGIAIKTKSELSPWVVEFNARWGDPEAQVLLPGLMNDLYEVSLAIASGDISKLQVQMDSKSRVVVSGTSRGYPGNYELVKDKQVFGLEEIREIPGVRLYGAGVTKRNGKYYANGGRLFYVVGEGDNIIEARQKAYGAMAVASVEDNNLNFRIDIGWRDVGRLRNG